MKVIFNLRKELKQNGNPLQKTLRLMITTVHGCSTRKQRPIKNKYSSNVEKAIHDYNDYIVGYDLNKDGKTGFVQRVLSFNPHFNYPQLSSSMIDHYNEFMEKIEKEVNILFRNIDAILVNESDYKKLCELGYVGLELGQFKLDKVFKEIAILSPMKRMGILADDLPYVCPKTKEIMEEDGLTVIREKFDAIYPDFKREVIENM